MVAQYESTAEQPVHGQDEPSKATPKTGLERIFDGNGNLLAVGHLVNGEKQGEWHEFAGDTVTMTTFAAGERHGYSCSVGGVMLTEGSYRNGHKDGVWLELHANGEWKTRTTFREGLRNGEYGEYTENGHKTVSGNHLDDLKDGTWCRYYENDTCRVCRSYRRGVPHGKYTKYFADGTISVLGTHEDGEKHGVWTYGYEDGLEKETVHYLHGQKHGEYQARYPDGTLKEHGLYKRGKKDGKWMTWYENGNNWSVYHYCNGMRHGDVRLYDEGGWKSVSCTYWDDKYHGDYFEYHYDGSVKHHTCWNNGKLVDKTSAVPSVKHDSHCCMQFLLLPLVAICAAVFLSRAIVIPAHSNVTQHSFTPLSAMVNASFFDTYTVGIQGQDSMVRFESGNIVWFSVIRHGYHRVAFEIVVYGEPSGHYLSAHDGTLSEVDHLLRCELFTVERLDDDQIRLKTCHGAYIANKNHDFEVMDDCDDAASACNLRLVLP